MNICQMCNRKGGCGCLWESSELCKKCGAGLRKEVLPLDIQMEIEAANTIHLHSRATGLGDSICVLYAAAGLAKQGYKVVFHTRHQEWLSRVQIDGVCLEPHAEIGIDASDDKRYKQQLQSQSGRKQWYSDAIAREAKIEAFEPSNRFKVLPPKNRRLEGHYVLFSPYSAWATRAWPVAHWQRLGELLAQKKFKIVVPSSSGDEAKLRADFGPVQGATYFWGQSAEWMLDVIQGAKCVIGNDSGIAHMAGLLGKRTVAIHSHLRPEHVFSHTNIVSMTPSDSCSFCAWSGTKGWTASCDKSGCSALMGISANRVFETVMQMIGGGK